MDKTRKDIILKEIQYWKEHRLLPEQYCNFLLTLYTEGSVDEQSVSDNKSYTVRQAFHWIFISYLIFQLPTTIVIIYFTELNILLQTLLFTFFVFTCVGSTLYLYHKDSNYKHLSIVVGLLIIFISSNELVNFFYTGSQIAIVVNVFMNCMLWFLLGFYLKLKYLMIAGSISAIILLLYKFL